MSINLKAFPKEGFVALALPSETIKRAVAIGDAAGGASEFLVRFKTEDGFKRFLISAVEAASLVWPGIAAEWNKLEREDAN